MQLPTSWKFLGYKSKKLKYSEKCEMVGGDTVFIPHLWNIIVFEHGYGTDQVTDNKLLI